MTPILAVAVFTAGALAGWRVTWRYAVTRSDIATYDARRDWRALHEQADHDHRSAVRWENALAAFRDVHDLVVGDLLDKVGERDRALARAPRTVRRSPVPSYGRWT